MNTQAKDKDLLESAYFRIDENGGWHHNGAPINRKALAKLFADKGLKIDEDGRYWLQSPFEKYPVEVDDVPFIITDVKEGEGGLDLITNMEEIVPLGREHPLELRFNEFQQMKLPYVHVRDGLYARLGRNVYHDLVQTYGASIKSRGLDHPLGEIEPE